MINIIELNRNDKNSIADADKLIAKVFPFRTLSERLTFWAFKHQDSCLVKKTMHFFGISSLSNFWVAVDNDNNIVGATGIYTYRKDDDEAVWLAWFCVGLDCTPKTGVTKKPEYRSLSA